MHSGSQPRTYSALLGPGIEDFWGLVWYSGFGVCGSMCWGVCFLGLEFKCSSFSGFQGIGCDDLCQQVSQHIRGVENVANFLEAPLLYNGGKRSALQFPRVK